MISEDCLDSAPLALAKAERTVIFDSVPPKPSKKQRYALFATALILLVLLVGFWPAFETAAGPMDEGMILVYPEMMLRGKLPYRDFETFYGPANPAVLATAFSAFGPNIFVERAVGLLYRMLIALAVFSVARRWGNTIGLGCLALTGCLLLGTCLPAFAWFGAVACALWSLCLGSRADSSTRSFLAGALGGLALLFRPDVGPAMILATLPLLHGMTWPTRRQFALGTGVGLLPLAILTFFTGLRPIVDNLFLIPVLHAGPARHLPLFSAPPVILTLFVAHLIASLVNVVAGVVAMRSEPRNRRGHLLLGVALLGLGLTHQAAQRLDSLHILFVAFLSFGILPLSFLVLGSRLRFQVAGRSAAVFACVTVIALLHAIVPELTMVVWPSFAAAMHSEPDATFAINEGRSFPFDSFKGAATAALVLKKLNMLAAPGDRLFVGPADLRRTNYNDTFLYHMTPKLTPATYFLEMNPASANRPGSRLASDVESADWLILNRAWDAMNEPNGSAKYGSNAPNAIVQRDFVQCGEFGGYLLWQRKVPRTR